MSGSSELAGPDFAAGVAVDQIPDGGSLLGHAGGEAVLLVRHGTRVRAVGASCTHYHGPLAEGLVVGDTIRCPWHHACFDLDTGTPSGPASGHSRPTRSRSAATPWLSAPRPLRPQRPQ